MLGFINFGMLFSPWVFVAFRADASLFIHIQANSVIYVLVYVDILSSQEVTSLNFSSLSLGWTFLFFWRILVISPTSLVLKSSSHPIHICFLINQSMLDIFSSKPICFKPNQCLHPWLSVKNYHLKQVILLKSWFFIEVQWVRFNHHSLRHCMQCS